jgi:hypothetical protein
MPATKTGTRQQRVIPIFPAPLPAARRLQRWRRLIQASFYLLFIFAPVFDLFRIDLNADHAWLLGMEWRLGLDALSGPGGKRGAGGAEYFPAPDHSALCAGRSVAMGFRGNGGRLFVAGYARIFRWLS